MLELTMILTIKREIIANAFKGTKLSIVQSRPSVIYAKDWQTWNLSKTLHRRIFRPKILHPQFHLISTVVVGKKHKKLVKMEKFTPLAKILHCRRH